MRNRRLLVIPFFLIFLLGCGLISGVQNIQNLKNAASTQLPGLQDAVSTQLPALLTSAPTAQGLIETAAAQLPTSACAGTPQAGGLGVSFDTARTVLQMTQQFQFADGTADGQPAVVATLTTTGASSFPDIAEGFTAQFIGDVCNLSRVTVTIPRSDKQETADQGLGVLNMVLTGTLPVDVQFSFLSWVTQNYPDLAVSGKQQTTIKNLQFTLQRNQTSMVLDILPVP
jgi:hypothetical protein